MRATGYVAVGSRIYAPGEELPAGLDNVKAADKSEATPEAPAPDPVAPAPDPVVDPVAPAAPVAAEPLPSDKAGLMELAEKLGLDTSGTKAVLTDRIVAAQAK